MKNLILEPTKYTPEVKFDYVNNILEISGKSYPEDTSHFYTPIIESLKKYIENLDKQKVIINFDIAYFNSSTSKVFMDIFDFLDESVNQGGKITVNWAYDKEDDSLLEYGEEFKEDLKFLPFNVQAKKSK